MNKIYRKNLREKEIIYILSQDITNVALFIMKTNTDKDQTSIAAYSVATRL